MSVNNASESTREGFLDIERGKVREFAQAVHAELEFAPDGEPIIPPTFLTTLNFTAGVDEMLSGFDLARTLHAGQEYDFESVPPHAGTHLTTTAAITDRFERSGSRGGVMRFAVETTRFHSDDGELVATARMTSVETQPATNAAASGEPAQTEPLQSAPAHPTASRTSTSSDRFASDNDRLAPEPFVFGPVTRTDLVRYQGASGDFNPIHHDDDFARAAGYPTAFAPGMFAAGLLASFATGWLGARNIRRFSVRFREQVWPGDVLTCSGAIAAVSTDAPTGGIVTVTLECRRQTGAVAVTGWASFATDGELPERV